MRVVRRLCWDLAVDTFVVSTTLLNLMSVAPLSTVDVVGIRIISIPWKPVLLSVKIKSQPSIKELKEGRREGYPKSTSQKILLELEWLREESQ